MNIIKKSQVLNYLFLIINKVSKYFFHTLIVFFTCWQYETLKLRSSLGSLSFHCFITRLRLHYFSTSSNVICYGSQFQYDNLKLNRFFIKIYHFMFHIMSSLVTWDVEILVLIILKTHVWLRARMYLQLPLRRWGAGNVYLLVLSS